MRGGFSFNGLDIYDLGLEYAPDNQDSYVWISASSSLSEEKVSAHDGGYFYGAIKQPKDFVLRCYYEDTDVRGGIMSKIDSYFKVGTTGKLYFKNRPWLYYIATVVAVDVSSMFNSKNGLVTINMRAYYPYARSDFNYLDTETNVSYQDVLKNSGMFTSAEQMPDSTIVAASELTNSTSFILYNPGTARANVSIEIAGDVDQGVIVSNSTTGQEMKFVAMSKAKTTNVGKHVVCDSMTGKTVLYDETLCTATPAFLYHSYGFIDLAPSYPIMRKVHAVTAENSDTVHMQDVLDVDVVGKYIWLNKWFKIVGQPDNEHIVVDSAVSDFDIFDTEIVTMNELTVRPIHTMGLTKLNFVYNATFY